MTLRGRITVSAALAVALAVVIASGIIYIVTARTLHRQVDRSLASIATELTSGPRARMFHDIRRGVIIQEPPSEFPFGPRRDPYGGAAGYVQVLDAGGQVILAAGSESILPVTERASGVTTTRQQAWETIDVDGREIRVLTVPVGVAAALQVARPLDEVAASLARLRGLLLVVGLIGVGGATGTGWIVGRRAVRPVADLTEAAEEVAATQDLSLRIATSGSDELTRLAHTFNQMLASLEQARNAQDQLIADASHELRTPLTSLRTNIEVLSSGAELSERDRQALATDVVAQLDEFGHLVSGLVELARGDTPVARVTEVALDELAEEAATRVGLHHPEAEIEVASEPTLVRGDPDRLERAIGNLVTNAVVHGGGSLVNVTVSGGAVTVRDRGPGIPEDELPYVMDRFHRAADARSRPGSGLGLSIVEQVAHAHAGTLAIRNHPDGGVEAVLRIPLGPTQPSAAAAPNG